MSIVAFALLVQAPGSVVEEKVAFEAQYVKLEKDRPGEKKQVTFQMVYVPGGRFKMGSPENEPGRDADEGPVREVEVKPFWMGKREVTWSEYDAFLYGEDEHADADTRPSWPHEPPDPGPGTARRAAMRIQYNGAMRYCESLSKRLKKKYRLPTEEEWEYACRAGSDKPAPQPLDEHAWFSENSEMKNQEVGRKKPNAFGLYDMLGGVWEYCATPKSHECEKHVKCSHVVRGGAWNSPASELRAANRQVVLKEWNARADKASPGLIWWLSDGPFCGFRVVRDVEAGEKR